MIPRNQYVHVPLFAPKRNCGGSVDSTEISVFVFFFLHHSCTKYFGALISFVLASPFQCRILLLYLLKYNAVLVAVLTVPNVHFWSISSSARTQTESRDVIAPQSENLTIDTQSNFAQPHTPPMSLLFAICVCAEFPNLCRNTSKSTPSQYLDANYH